MLEPIMLIVHLSVWRDTVADMMAQPRSSTKFTNVFPSNEGW
jgi:autoinducer 2-degrading protein